MKAILFIYKTVKRYPVLIFISGFFLLLSSLIDAVTVFSLVVIADLFFNPSLNAASPISNYIITALNNFGLPYSLLWVMMYFLFFSFIKTVFQIFSQYQILRIKYAILRDTIVETFKDFFAARWYFFASNKQGTLLNTFNREIAVVGDAVGTLGFCFASIVQAVLFLAVPFYLSWQLTSIVILMSFVLALPFLFLGKLNYRLGRLNTLTANEFNKVVHEGLNYTKIILGFNNQEKLKKALENSFDAHCLATLKSQTLNRGMPMIYYPFALIILFIGLLISRKIALPLSETMVLFYSLSRVVPVIGTIIGHKSSIDNFLPSYEQIMNLRQQAKGLIQQSGSRKFVGFSKELILENLSFAYPHHRPVLNNINMFIPKGRMIAIIGNSGAGKSTLIDMIMRFNEPVSGRITFDGVDAKEFEISSYRYRIGYVPQDSVLFNMSIRENLVWANEFASDEEIKNACLQANAEEFIQRLPDGYNTLVGDRGVRLSGGQVQRIALARAILRKPQLLILDEATSALDTYSERLIQSAIENITKETTVIAVAHRLSTIVRADYIYLLKDSFIIEEGTYSELIQKNGRFKKMVELQSLGISE